MIKTIILSVLSLAPIALMAQDKPTLVVSSGHHQTLMCVDISPNGQHVASGGTDNIVKIYDMKMQQELNTITGHSSQISFLQFAPSGEYLMSASRNELLVHSHPEGKLSFRKALALVDDYEFYMASDNTLYIAQEDEGITAYNVTTGEIVKTYPAIDVEGFMIMPDEKTLVATIRDDEKGQGIGFFSFPGGELQDFIPVENLVFSRYEASRDGKTIAFEAGVCEVAILDVKTKTIKTRIKAGVGMLNIMKLTPNGKQLVTSTFDNFVRYWDVNTGKKEREIADISPSGGMVSMALAIKDMDFSDDGKLAVFCYSDLMDGKQLYTVEWFDAKSMKSMGKHAGDVKLSLSISIDQSGKILSTGTVSGAMGVKCLDISKGNQKAFLPGIAYHGAGGEYLAATSYNMEKGTPQMDIYQMPAIRKVKSFDVHGYGEMSMSPTGKYASMVDVKQPPNNDYTKGAAVPMMRIWNVETEKEVAHISRTITDMPRKCLFNTAEDKAYILYQKRIETVDLATGKVIKSVDVAFLNTGYSNVVSPDGTKIIGSSPDGIYAIDVATGESTYIMQFEELINPLSVAFSPDNSLFAVAALCFERDMPNRVLVYNWADKSLKCDLKGHTTSISQLVIGSENKHLFSVDNNGVIAMWDLDLCQPKASFLAFGEEDYIMNTPDGFYKSSKGNLAKVGFRQKGKLYTFDQFDLRYNRPDKVLEGIGIASDKQISMYRKAYQKRLSRMGFSEEDFSSNVSAPEIEILQPELLPLTTTEDFVNIDLLAKDAQFDLDRLSITVNGVPLYGKLGKSLKGTQIKEMNNKMRVPLVNGTNRIQVSVMNVAGIESTRETYSVECTKAYVKPDLYIVAYGVRSYQDSSMNLTYSDKDAQDMVEMFKKDVGPNGHYNTVTVQLLTNDEVLKEKVADAKAMLMKSDVDDQAILFYSGHGLLNENMDYFLSTHDVDFANPDTRGLPFNDFQDLIDGIPARNRLMFVDACHSGEVDRDEVAHAPVRNEQDGKALTEKGFAAKGKKVVGLGNTFELMKELFVELRQESGATIIASSAGKEFSLESDEWKNGVFTFALKEALLQGKADENKDDTITVSELKRYLFDRVKELTDGKQTPTVRRENLQHDNVIY